MLTHIEAVHKPNRVAQWFASSFAILGAHRRAYVWLNITYYGLIVAAMLYATFNPALQQTITAAAGTAFTQGPLAAVGEAYLGGQTLRAILLTFGINLVVGSGLTITLPSLIVPFSGLLMGAYRAILWGLIYAPNTPELRMILLPHLPTLIIEGQAYVLAMLAAVIQGRALLASQSVKATTRREAYRRGIKLTLRIYGLGIVVLAIAAVYEVLEAAVLLARFA